MRRKFLQLLVVTPLLFISAGCIEKTIHIKTKCASIPTYKTDGFSRPLDYEVYQVEENGRVSELVKGIPIDVWVDFVNSYKEYKTCCETMNLNAGRLNEFNSQK